LPFLIQQNKILKIYCNFGNIITFISSTYTTMKSNKIRAFKKVVKNAAVRFYQNKLCCKCCLNMLIELRKLRFMPPEFRS